MFAALRSARPVFHAAPRHAASISTTGKSYVEVFDARMAWVANQLKSATSRDEFDKAAAANNVDFAAFIEADIKPSHTLDDYRKSFNAFVADQPIVVNTVDTLDWVISSPPELHLFEEYPALKLVPDAHGNVEQ